MPTTGHPGADLIIYTAGLLVALGTVYRYIWPFPRRAILAVWRVLRGFVHFVEMGGQILADYRLTGGFAGLAEKIAEVKALAQDAHHELHPNKGDSLRDAVDEGRKDAQAAAADARRAVEEATRIGQITESLQGSVAQLRGEQSTQGQRITDHRRRNDEQISALREYLEKDREQLMLAKQGLEASVTELLMVESHKPRPPDPEQ